MRSRSAVHPRMRGEHETVRRLEMERNGSSPHARGTHSISDFCHPSSRFIPACAGNTAHGLALYCFTAVHPRMRGEHCRLIRGIGYGCGSSPHARGTLTYTTHYVLSGWFIPACAGNTSMLWIFSVFMSVHPRMRGEHRSSRPKIAVSCGSSPHARGTRVKQRGYSLLMRFIPACAGNTRTRSSRPMCNTVHPRMRGEHVARCVVLAPRHGSSPHARGTLARQAARAAYRRFIPACAGNTFFALLFFAAAAVHPRMRGEHLDGRHLSVDRNGSSPHARGTRSTSVPPYCVLRFIPACAGNTYSAGRPVPCPAVHPRMRGEHCQIQRAAKAAGGSSPHARGTLLSELNDFSLERFIPACAGNTLLISAIDCSPSVHPRMRGEHSSYQNPSK